MHVAVREVRVSGIPDLPPRYVSGTQEQGNHTGSGSSMHTAHTGIHFISDQIYWPRSTILFAFLPFHI